MLRIARLALLAVVAVACGESPAEPPGPADPGPGDPVPSVSTVTGIVRSSATGDRVAGAEVTIGEVTATTDDDGSFTLGPVDTGVTTIRCTATGYATFEALLDVKAGGVRRDMALTRLEHFEFEEFALYVPDRVSRARAILLTLGGPDTRGFASDSAFGAPVPEVEAALHALGEEFRGLAAEKGLAVLGTSRAALPNGPESDALLRDAVEQAAALSGRPELSDVPLVIYGMSGGAPQASGLAARSPERVAALFLKVPADVQLLDGGPAVGVPTHLVLAENDAFVDNAALEAAFRANRTAGALWALALERDAIHFSLSPAQRALTLDWMGTVLDRRLGDGGSGALAPIEETAGWLGDPDTRAVARWADYRGDLSSASWFPTAETGLSWAAFLGTVTPPVSSVHVDPAGMTLEPGLVGSLAVEARDAKGSRIAAPWQAASDDESVVRVRTDPGCEPDCTQLTVLAVGPGTATITASYEGLEASVVVTVDYDPASAPWGLYDLEATILTFDPAWGDLTGWRYTGILRPEADPAQPGSIGGTYSALISVAPDGEWYFTGGDGTGTGVVRSYFAQPGGVLDLELASDFFTMDLFPRDLSVPADSLPSRLEGTFWHAGMIGGTFVAERRPAN